MNEPRWSVVAGVVTGVALASVGVVSLLRESTDTHPGSVVRWVIGLALVHDLVLVPIVLAVGVGLRRWAPKAWVAAALLVSGVVTLVAWPFVRGYGRLANNPSILPRNYGRGLAIVLALTWLVALGGALAFRFTGKQNGRRPS
jgi:hypothetical protein